MYQWQNDKELEIRLERDYVQVINYSNVSVWVASDEAGQSYGAQTWI